MPGRNGWRDGTDPIQRGLRVVTTMVVLGVFVFLSVSVATAPNAGVTDRILAAALAIGAVLLLLGYEGVVRLPFLGGDDSPRRRSRGKDDDDGSE